MKNQKTKKYLLAKLKLAEMENNSLKLEISDSDFQRIALLKSNEMLIKEKESDDEFKKDYIESYKHIRFIEKSKIEMQKEDKSLIAQILPIGLGIILDYAKNIREEQKEMVKPEPCTIKPMSVKENKAFIDLKPIPRP